jgi:putative acetyltransferase
MLQIWCSQIYPLPTALCAVDLPRKGGGEEKWGDRAMMATAHPKLALRPFLPEDVPLLAEVFRAAVTELTADDYSEAQQEAWASAAEDEAAFGMKLASELTLIATLEGSAVGFASLEGKDKIDMLYVHPAVAGQGVGAMLIDALEKLAGGRGVVKLKVDASDSARGFFEKRGYVAQQRNTVTVAGEWLANTTLQKQLAAKGASDGQA